MNDENTVDVFISHNGMYPERIVYEAANHRNDEVKLIVWNFAKKDQRQVSKNSGKNTYSIAFKAKFKNQYAKGNSLDIRKVFL